MAALYDFVKARVNERAEWALNHLPPDLGWKPPPAGVPYWLDAAGYPIVEPREQVLDDVYAMDVLLTAHAPPEQGQDCIGCGLDYIGNYAAASDDCRVLRALAWRWRAHPGWQAQWEPPVPMDMGGQRQRGPR